MQHTVLIHEMEQGSQVTRGRCIVGKLVQRHRVRVVLQCLREWKRLPCGSASCLFAARCAVRWAEGDVDSEAFVLGNAPACDGKARTRSTASSGEQIVNQLIRRPGCDELRLTGLGPCAQQNCRLGCGAVCPGGVHNLELRELLNMRGRCTSPI